MTTLFIIRHGKTKSNLRDKIQGPRSKSSLSMEGKKQIANIVNDNRFRWMALSRIITSPTLRAKQSGNLISKSLNFHGFVETDMTITDFEPGILGGLSPNEAKIKYPKYHQIWNQRGDLDGIPGGEKGEVLQARVLVFLEQYLNDKQKKMELIISHAGFIRCLINTIKGVKRNCPVEVDHSFVHSIINPWKKIKIKKFSLEKSSGVYKIKTRDQEYVLKIRTEYPQKRAKLQSEILNYLVINNFPISPVLYSLTKNDGQQKTIQILRFLPGKNCFGKLAKQKTTALIYQIFNLHNLLKEFSVKNKNLNKALVTFDTKVIKAIETTSDTKLKMLGKKLFKTIKSKYSGQSNTIVYWDLHRGNILFDNNNINFIDFDCLILAPEIFQLSCLLAAINARISK